MGRLITSNCALKGLVMQIIYFTSVWDKILLCTDMRKEGPKATRNYAPVVLLKNSYFLCF